MKKISLFAIILLLCKVSSVHAESYVQGYTRKDGRQVQGYYRSNNDNTVQNNYSYRGNTNPYNGNIGSSRYPHDATSPYYNGPDQNGRVGHPNGYPSPTYPIQNPNILLPPNY